MLFYHSYHPKAVVITDCLNTLNVLIDKCFTNTSSIRKNYVWRLTSMIGVSHTAIRLISSLLSFRRVNIRHLELIIPKCAMSFYLLGNRNYASVSSQSVREHRLWCSQSLCKFYSCEYTLSGATCLRAMIVAKLYLSIPILFY